MPFPNNDSFNTYRNNAELTEYFSRMLSKLDSIGLELSDIRRLMEIDYKKEQENASDMQKVWEDFRDDFQKSTGVKFKLANRATGGSDDPLTDAINTLSSKIDKLNGRSSRTGFSISGRLPREEVLEKQLERLKPDFVDKLMARKGGIGRFLSRIAFQPAAVAAAEKRMNEFEKVKTKLENVREAKKDLSTSKPPVSVAFKSTGDTNKSVELQQTEEMLERESEQLKESTYRNADTREQKKQTEKLDEILKNIKDGNKNIVEISGSSNMSGLMNSIVKKLFSKGGLLAGLAVGISAATGYAVKRVIEETSELIDVEADAAAEEMRAKKSGLLLNRKQDVSKLSKELEGSGIKDEFNRIIDPKTGKLLPTARNAWETLSQDQKDSMFAMFELMESESASALKLEASRDSKDIEKMKGIRSKQKSLRESINLLSDPHPKFRDNFQKQLFQRGILKLDDGSFKLSDPSALDKLSDDELLLMQQHDVLVDTPFLSSDKFMKMKKDEQDFNIAQQSRQGELHSLINTKLKERQGTSQNKMKELDNIKSKQPQQNITVTSLPNPELEETNKLLAEQNKNIEKLVNKEPVNVTYHVSKQNKSVIFPIHE